MSCFYWVLAAGVAFVAWHIIAIACHYYGGEEAAVSLTGTDLFRPLVAYFAAVGIQRNGLSFGQVGAEAVLGGAVGGRHAG